MVPGASRHPWRYPRTLLMEMGWQGVLTHLGVTMTGRRSARYLSISNEALPEPQYHGGPQAGYRHRAVPEDFLHFMTGAQVLAQVRVIRVAQAAQVNDPAGTAGGCDRRHV
jgi:hypothetical protein